jgi:hypothetical protein
MSYVVHYFNDKSGEARWSPTFRTAKDCEVWLDSSKHLWVSKPAVYKLIGLVTKVVEMYKIVE